MTGRWRLAKRAPQADGTLWLLGAQFSLPTAQASAGSAVPVAVLGVPTSPATRA
jgi:hypothetical protein